MSNNSSQNDKETGENTENIEMPEENTVENDTEPELKGIDEVEAEPVSDSELEKDVPQVQEIAETEETPDEQKESEEIIEEQPPHDNTEEQDMMPPEVPEEAVTENGSEEQKESGENEEQTDELPVDNQIPNEDSTAKKSSDDILNIPKISVILGLITVVTVFLLAVLNNITVPVIEGRRSEEKASALSSLFGENVETSEFRGELLPSVDELLYVRDKDNNFIGYCVHVYPKGFGGKIDMLVAIDPDGKITGINILELSETAGIGTLVVEDSFLGQFRNKSDIYGIDMIAGATVSSRAVTDGVDAALKQLESAEISN